jgi:prepilin-type N-terminal cleavage/methylation domain-containing protein
VNNTPKRASAFTLVEIMIAVVIIGLLAAMAVAAFVRIRERSLSTRMANDFRQYAAAFEHYALESGSWPAATTIPGEIPLNMGPYLPATYSQPSAMGGGYTWSGTSGRLRLINTQATDAVMVRVDLILDDGDLSSGDFMRMVSGGYHWQLH